jgi:hypothetical protein
MRVAFIVVLLIIAASFVSAEGEVVYTPELNTNNFLDVAEGQSLELSTRVLRGPETVSDASCSVVIADAETFAVVMTEQPLPFDEIQGEYNLNWNPPPPSAWEQFLRMFRPGVSMYLATVSCTGGSTLDVSVLTDGVLMRVYQAT